MKITGIIAEYNPFHNGHSYHLAQSRCQSHCDAVVAVMSGSFVQRGEPAAFDKWARTRMALACGVDAVFELPAFYALQSADWFAHGGTSVLDGLGVDCLSFGSEQPGLEQLSQLSGLWDDEPDEVKAAIKLGMKAGKTHPKARSDALEAWSKGSNTAQSLASPNSVLGAMYLRCLKQMSSTMEPLAIQRIEAAYNDEAISGSIASATAVRRALAQDNTGSWHRAVPDAVAVIIDSQTQQGTGPVFSDDLGQMLLYALRTSRNLPDTAEGLDNRMLKAAFAAGSAEEYYAAVKCKRYTMARIKRASMQALLGITAQDIQLIRTEKPIYARLLGYSRRVDGLVNELARRAKIPFIVRTSGFAPDSPAAARLWQLDLAASDIYALARQNPALQQGKRDFTEKLIVL
jgi:predicted nucleotidyltransferase